MPNIRFMVATATIIAALTFPVAPASARFCDGESACVETKPGAPLYLHQFLKKSPTAKPVQGVAKKSTVAKAPIESPPPAGQPSAAAMESRAEVTAAAEPDGGPVRTIETDGIAIRSADELNEIDSLADKVRVVAANELNEIDVAAPTAIAALNQNAQALQSMVSADQPSADLPPKNIAWIGKLLLALSGTIAIAGVARLLIA